MVLKKRLIELINWTRDTLLIGVFAFTDVDVADAILALLHAPRSTAQVQLLLHQDHTSASDVNSVTHMLSDHERVSARVSTDLHCKVVLIDDRYYLTGSGSANVTQRRLTRIKEVMWLYGPGGPFFDGFASWIRLWANAKHLSEEAK